jgi:NADPH:quinone reductase
MKSVGYKTPGPISAPESFVDFTATKPSPKGHDILVEVKAISVNPVDVKIRASGKPAGDEHKVLGWDAAGIVAETGPDVTLFKKGDAVWYAGSITRPGTNSEFHLVDERIVGAKPTRIGFAEAAALPLTAITAWEMLFDRLDIRKPVPGAAKAILIVGGAGGVGSIATQLVKALTDVKVIATASRPDTIAWVKSLGADHVVDHSKPLAAEVAALGIGAPAFVFSTNQSDHHFEQIVELIAPQGRFGLIDDPDMIDIRKLKRKAVSTHWELMFTRSMFGTADMIEQHRLLSEVSKLVDSGKIKTTLAENFGTINAANLKRAHEFIETGRAKGKVVLEGF